MSALVCRSREQSVESVAQSSVDAPTNADLSCQGMSGFELPAQASSDDTPMLQQASSELDDGGTSPPGWEDAPANESPAPLLLDADSQLMIEQLQTAMQSLNASQSKLAEVDAMVADIRACSDEVVQIVADHVTQLVGILGNETQLTQFASNASGDVHSDALGMATDELTGMASEELLSLLPPQVGVAYSLASKVFDLIKKQDERTALQLRNARLRKLESAVAFLTKQVQGASGDAVRLVSAMVGYFEYASGIHQGTLSALLQNDTVSQIELLLEHSREGIDLDGYEGAAGNALIREAVDNSTDAAAIYGAVQELRDAAGFAPLEVGAHAASVLARVEEAYARHVGIPPVLSLTLVEDDSGVLTPKGVEWYDQDLSANAKKFLLSKTVAEIGALGGMVQLEVHVELDARNDFSGQREQILDAYDDEERFYPDVGDEALHFIATGTLGGRSTDEHDFTLISANGKVKGCERAPALKEHLSTLTLEELGRTTISSEAVEHCRSARQTPGPDPR